jgi:hypothetical protein
MKSSAVVLAVLVAAGCARPHVATLPPAEDAEGVYDFTASVSTFEGQAHFEGSFEITGDTVLALMYDRHCIPQPGSLTHLSYRCGATRFTFERNRPLRRPTLSFEVSVPSSERFCERYQSTTEGQVCISWSVRTTYKRQQYTVRPTVVLRATEPPVPTRPPA